MDYGINNNIAVHDVHCIQSAKNKMNDGMESWVGWVMAEADPPTAQVLKDFFKKKSKLPNTT